mmetsp:Transcript_13395/g.22022  ORF Transcript_13395/g.22022 Transcript_13395/m.22022 type:complete len:375 (-) Transcript_13395:106-1230(-)
MACEVCHDTCLLAAGILDVVCPLCDIEFRMSSGIDERKAVATTSNRHGRASLAAQTLKIQEQGGYWLDGKCIILEPMLRHSISSTVLYPANGMRAESRADRLVQTSCKTIIEVTEETTIQAGARIHAELGVKAGGALCLLNFASAKNPGGGFQGGSLAQEESLALSSGLYACLVNHMNDFYTPHRGNPNDGLYSHAMLYSPRVPFFRGDSGSFSAMWCAGVVTSPAPNAGVARKKRSDNEIVVTLRERIGRILSVAADQGHTHLVLGAFGCGVFRNDANEVAAAFDYWLRGCGKYAGAFEKIVFAIPFDERNFPAFSEHFGDRTAIRNVTSVTARKMENPVDSILGKKRWPDVTKGSSRKGLRRQKYETVVEDE